MLPEYLDCCTCLELREVTDETDTSGCDGARRTCNAARVGIHVCPVSEVILGWTRASRAHWIQVAQFRRHGHEVQQADLKDKIGKHDQMQARDAEAATSNARPRTKRSAVEFLLDMHFPSINASSWSWYELQLCDSSAMVDPSCSGPVLEDNIGRPQ